MSLVYNSVQDKTTVTMPYTSNVPVQLVYEATTGETVHLETERLSASSFTVQGDITNAVAIRAGLSYLFRYKFSRQYNRRFSQNGNSVIMEGRLQLQYLSILYHDTAQFKVTVSPQDRDPWTIEFNSRLAGTGAWDFGAMRYDTGTFRVPLKSRADRVGIEITSDSPFACNFASAEWRGQFTPRAARLN